MTNRKKSQLNVIPKEDVNHNLLYRHYGFDGSLLYAGRSNSIARRLSEHKRSGWARDIARVELEHFDSLEDAIKAENKAINTENPKFNVTQNIEKSTQPIKPKKTNETSEIRTIQEISEHQKIIIFESIRKHLISNESFNKATDFYMTDEEFSGFTGECIDTSNSNLMHCACDLGHGAKMITEGYTYNRCKGKLGSIGLLTHIRYINRDDGFLDVQFRLNGDMAVNYLLSLDEVINMANKKSSTITTRRIKCKKQCTNRTQKWMPLKRNSKA